MPRAGRWKGIRVVAMDVDGVLTAGDIIVLESGEEVKLWNVKDRLAFFVGRAQGLTFVWITARDSKQVKARAKDVKVDALYAGCRDKKSALADLCRRFRVSPREVAYLGDDLIDLPVLRRVGLAACPSDAPTDVKRAVHYVSSLPGGRGVLRDVVDRILKAQGKWSRVLASYC